MLHIKSESSSKLHALFSWSLNGGIYIHNACFLAGLWRVQHSCHRKVPRIFSYQTAHWKSHVSLVLHHSYKRRHHCGGVAQSLDSCIRTLLEIMVVPGHVEGRESGATTLHRAGYSRGCERHSQAAVWRQRSLDWMRNGCSYGWSAGTQGTQRLWMLKSRETGWGGYPGTEGQVVRCCKCWPCKQREIMPDASFFRQHAKRVT